MATDQDDSDIPESGGVFTFGKSRFAENLPNKFWIRNDEVRQVACGDEHTVLLAESGRVFVFGDNSYGQLGLGNTKPQNKPSCVKSLKGESVSVVGCGKSHTLIGTTSGQLFTFGSNSDHQCAVDMDGSVETPTEVLLDEPIVFKQLCAGSSHSAGLDSKNRVWVWGDNSEGQLGLGDSLSEVEKPTRLKIDEKPIHISCGYYHTAIVTESGNLYTFGEAESGKLGHGEGILASEPLEVEISDRVVWASCGGRHTIAVTAKGHVYAFGDGSSGQLGLGTNELESSTPTQLSLRNIKVKYASCGENFTALVTDGGQLYTCGDGRHGKLALGAESFTNQFRPFRVPRFSKFKVTKVGCGGCHMIALAHKSDSIAEEEEELEDPLNSTIANSLRLSVDADLGGSISARDRRRAKEPVEQALSRTLPPLTSSSRGLPPLTSSLPGSKLKPLNSGKLPSTLDKRKLPEAKFSKDYTHAEDDEEDSDVSVTPEGSSAEEEDNYPNNLKSKRELMKKQSEKIANGKGKPQPLKKPNSRTQREEDSEEESEEEDSEEEERSASKYNKKAAAAKSSKKKVQDSEEESEPETKTSKSVAAKNKKNKSKSSRHAESEEEADSALEDSEEEMISSKNKKSPSKKNVKDTKKKKKVVDSDEEESEEERTPSKTDPKKSKFSLFGKNKKANLDISEEEEEDEEPAPTKSKKGKESKSSKDKKKSKESEEEDEGDDNEENAGGDNKKKGDNSDKNKAEEKPPEGKKTSICTIL